MKQLNWKLIAVIAFIVLLIALGAAKACHAQTTRPYHVTSITTMAAGKYAWTHVEVRGTVVYVKAEPDGDTHIKLVDPWNASGPFVICECTPKEPCAKPRVGADIIVRGISRKDPEHLWYEVHPVESWRSATAGE